MFKRYFFFTHIIFLAVLASAILGLSAQAPAALAASGPGPEEQPAAVTHIYLPLVVRSPGIIYGRVTEGGANAAGVPVTMRFFNGSAWSSLATVETDAAGAYRFASLPGLGQGHKYQVVFENAPQSASRLAWWGSNEITSYAAGSSLEMSSFDIAAVTLLTPGHDQLVSLPANFQWNRRAGSTSDSYALRLYDTTDFNPLYVSPYVGYAGSFVLNSLPAGFSAGAGYTWDVILRSPDGGTGVSRQAHLVKLANGIHGWATQNGAAAGGIPLQLRFFNGASWSTVLSTTTNSDGGFVFANAPTLGAGQKYYVRYQNVTQVAGRLFLWSTRTLTSYTAGTSVLIGSFDIADVALVAPAGGSTVSVPQLFQWTPRPASTSDGYILEIYDPADYDPRWLSPLMGHTGSYTLFGVSPNLNLNTSYAWDLVISAPDGGSGVSRMARLVRFSNRGTSFEISAAEWPFDEELPPRPDGSIENGE